MKQELICIVCPKGCHLTAEQTAEGWQIAGYGCPRGQQYGVAEMTNPTRVVTSTVRITGGIHPRLPVKTDGALPRSLVRRSRADAGYGGSDRSGGLRTGHPSRYRRNGHQLCGQPGYVNNSQTGRSRSFPFVL